MENPKATLLMRLCDLLPENPTIVEIGSARSLIEDPTDGWSTVYLGRRAATFYSVDNSAEVMAIAQRVLSREGVHCMLIHGDGAEVLTTWDWDQPIHLLYLDSSNNPYDTFLQAKAGRRNMSPGGIIVIDDVQPIGANWFGKGTLAIPFLIQNGWTCTIEPTLWQDGNCWAMAWLRRQ